MKKKVLSTISGMLFTTAVLANSPQYYAGASILSAETDLASESKYNSGYEVHVGYKINTSFAVEASYLDLGNYNINRTNTKYSIASDAVSISALYSYPLGGFNLTGKLGYLTQNNDISITPSEDNYRDESGGGLVFGAGIGYKFRKNLEVKAEFNVAKYTNYGALGFSYYF